jgi:hypothetical protein
LIKPHKHKQGEAAPKRKSSLHSTHPTGLSAASRT